MTVFLTLSYLTQDINIFSFKNDDDFLTKTLLKNFLVVIFVISTLDATEITEKRAKKLAIVLQY
jgi:hypothetical protein